MHILVVEDERENAERLIHLLGQCSLEIDSIVTLESVAASLAWFSDKTNHADIVFMDIMLSDGDCFEIFERIESSIPIIFTTAYDSYALKAFKLFSIDYLLKPIDLKDLQSSLHKFKELRSPIEQKVQVEKVIASFFSQKERRFVGKINNQLVYVKSSDLAYVKIDLGVVWAMSHNNNRIPLDYTLDQIEHMLDPQVFFRINRKVIVHLDAMTKIMTYSNSRLELKLKFEDESHIVSRERVNDFKTWLAGGS